MSLLFRGAKTVSGQRLDVAVMDGGMVSTAPSICSSDFDRVLDMDGTVVFPGFADAHVHLRQPGFSYKETVLTGTRAAARAGYAWLMTMPNLNPAPDCRENVELQWDLFWKDARVNCIPFGTLSAERKGRAISDMAGMADRVVGFSDDGSGIEDDALMRDMMLEAKRLDKIISQHCEVMSLPGSDPKSEWGMVERDLRLVEETGCTYHVCHISTKETVELVRQAKKKGMKVTCETAPHYLLLNLNDVKDEGRFKMNPPIRSKMDQEALVAGLLDGTVDIIATDHAPHSAEEKSRGFEKSLMGIVGLETAFPVMYNSGILTLERLVDAMSIMPRKIFGLPCEKDFAFFDLNETYTIDPDNFLSMGRSTPFAGWTGKGVCRANIVNGKIVWPEETV